MKTIPLSGHVQKDGTLDLKVQTGLEESDVDVVIVVEPKEHPKGWPPGFFEETYGAFADTPLERPPQGIFEVREAPE
jgi:hypothetical protein